MTLNYLAGKPRKELQKLHANFEAHDKLLSNMQLCGVFSDKLIERVYVLSWRALGVRIKRENAEIEKPDADKDLHNLYSDFKGLFDAYNIFSAEFKAISMGLFWTVCFSEHITNKSV